jgi:hypothetical protein
MMYKKFTQCSVAGCIAAAGSRDYTLKLWDARVGTSALFTFGVAKGDFAATTHAEMVTCVDVAGDLVVSGSLDQSLAAWDLRSMGQPGAMRPLAVAGPTSVSAWLVACAAQLVHAGLLKVWRHVIFSSSSSSSLSEQMDMNATNTRLEDGRCKWP